MTTDEELVELCRKDGDRGALEELATRYTGKAYNLSLHVTGSPDLAEDASQQAFVGLISGLATFREGMAFKPWFYRIAVNAARRIRSREAAQKGREKVVQASTAGEYDMNPNEELFREEVRSSVMELPEDLRLPVVLHYYDNMTYAEAAEVLECPGGTIGWRIRRALDELKKKLTTAGFPAMLAGLPKALEAVPEAKAPPALISKIAELCRNARIEPVPPVLPTGAIAGSGAFAKTVALMFAGILATGLIIVLGFGLNGSAMAPGTGVAPRGTVAESPPETAPVEPATGTGGPSDVTPTAAPAPSPAPKTELAKGGWTLRGRIVDLKGKGLPGASLYVDFKGQTLGRTRALSPLGITSGKDGRFEKKGLTDWQIKGFDPNGLTYVTVNHRAHPIRSVSLNSSKRSGNVIDMGDVVLTDGLTVSGRAVDSLGSAVPGAKIYADDDRYMLDLFVRQATSDNDGAYTIRGVVAGTYYIRAFADGHPPYRSKPVVIKDGSLEDVEIEFRPSGVIKGTVRDTAGKPIPGCKVGINRERHYVYTDPETGETTSSWSMGGDMPFNPDNDEFRGMLEGIDLKGMLEGLDPKEPRDERKSPEEPKEKKTPKKVRVVESFKKETRTDSKGRYVLRGIPYPEEGDEEFTIVVYRFPDMETTHFFSGESPPFSQSKNGQAGEDVDFTFKRFGTISGIFIDADTGKPVTQAVKLVLRPVSPDFKFGMETTGLFDNCGGKFIFKGIVYPGTPEITVFSEGYFPVRKELKVAEGRTVKTEIKLKRGSKKVSGRVVDNSTGKPVEGAEVKVYEWISRWGWGVSETVATDNEGRFEFSVRLLGSAFDREVTHWVQATKKPHMVKKVTGSFSGDTAEYELRLKTGATLKGVLVTEGSARGKFVTIALANYTKRRWTTKIKTDSGEFEFKSLNAGRYIITCGSARKYVDLKEGETVDVEIEFKR